MEEKRVEEENIAWMLGGDVLCLRHKDTVLSESQVLAIGNLSLSRYGE
jgi:hypothetical protein